METIIDDATSGQGANGSWLRLDANGNLDELKMADRSKTYTYDGRGNKPTETDPAGNVTH